MKPIKEYADHASDATAFLTKFPSPVLVYREHATAGDRAFKTMYQPQGPTTSESDFSPDLACLVVPLIKKSDSPYPDRITLGRTLNMDIVLPYPNISKLHAYFTWSEDRTTWEIVDVGSTNGTFLAGRRLAANQVEKLSDGVLLNFWHLAFKFYLPAGFRRLLQTVK